MMGIFVVRLLMSILCRFLRLWSCCAVVLRGGVSVLGHVGANVGGCGGLLIRIKLMKADGHITMWPKHGFG